MSRAPNGLAHILHDDRDSDQGSTSVYVTIVVRGSQLRTLKENGRHYQVHDHRVCVFPCDGAEHERQDLLHHCIYGILLRHLNPREPVTTDESGHRQYNVLTNVIAPCEPVRVLDLGCGTGIWALDIAQRYPLALVEGGDVVGAQPRPAQNVRWRTPQSGINSTLDFEQGVWHGISNNAYSLVHASQLCGSVSNWDRLVQNSYDSLCSGGWFESIEIDYQPCCDDGSLPSGSSLNEWWYRMTQATSDKPIQYPHHLPALLHKAGFTNVQRISIPIPSTEWPRHHQGAAAWLERIMLEGDADPSCDQLWLNPADWLRRVSQAGIFFNSILTNDESLPLADAISGMSMAVLTRNCAWSKQQVDVLVQDLMRCLSNPAFHTYFRLHIVIAQKPGG